MRLFICGIGGTGGKIASNFLENTDFDSNWLSMITQAEYAAPGGTTGIYIEADERSIKNHKVFRNFDEDLVRRGYPCFVIPFNEVDDNLIKAVQAKYGYYLKKQGFVRDAQYLKAIFEILDTDADIQKEDGRINAESITIPEIENNPSIEKSGIVFKYNSNPIFNSAWDAIKQYTIIGEGECDTILFIISLGGGTGTGFINPIVDHIKRKEGRGEFPIFVLGVLTGPGDRIESGQFSFEGERYLAAISALYDLLTVKGADGIILMDNEILDGHKGADSDYKFQNGYICSAMESMIAGRDYPDELDSQAMAKDISRGLPLPPILVPFYWHQSRRDYPEKEKDLVSKAINGGKLFDCSPERADKAIVFCRGFINEERIVKSLSEEIWPGQEYEAGRIQVYRKLGEKEDEVLILLRNPYGCDPEAYNKPGTLEHKFCEIIDKSLMYMNKNPQDLFYEGSESKERAKQGKDLPRLTPLCREKLEQFFFGKEGYVQDNIGISEGLAFELKEAKKKLQEGKRKPSEDPFFSNNPIKILKESEKRREMKPRAEHIDLDEQRILEIVDKRIDKRLADMESIRRE